MPIIKRTVLNSLKALCGKYDRASRKHAHGKTYREFRKFFEHERVIRLILNEVNGWTLTSRKVLKHQRVEGLRTLLNKRKNWAGTGFPGDKIIEKIADLIVSLQNQQDRYLRSRSKKEN